LEPDTIRHGSLVIPAPNLNIMESSSVIPVLEGALEPGITVWACAVRAGDKEPVMREKVPSVVFRKNGEAEIFDGDGKSTAVLAI
jgi:hypothetical protein